MMKMDKMVVICLVKRKLMQSATQNKVREENLLQGIQSVNCLKSGASAKKQLVWQ